MANNKLVNQLNPASLPLVDADIVLVSRDGASVTRATVGDVLDLVPTGSSDASAVTYTPATLGDWSGVDPGNVDDALDYLAANAGGGGGQPVGTNTPYGDSALDSFTTGTDNTGIGYHSLTSITDAIENTAVGSGSMEFSSGPESSTAIGFKSQQYASNYGNTSLGAYAMQMAANAFPQSYNTAVGIYALAGNSSNFGGITRNTAIGASSLENIDSGSSNTCVGFESGYNASQSNGNVFLGYATGWSSIYGSYNVAIGYQTLFNCTEGADNVAVGDSACYSVTTGDENVGIGPGALRTTTTGNYNIGIGSGAGYAITTGSDNISIGRLTMQGFNFTSTTGYDNVAIGRSSSYTLLDGYENTSIGTQSLEGIISGYDNVAAGFRSAPSVNSGYRNVGLGAFSLFNLSDGFHNTAVGFNSLNNQSSVVNSSALGYTANVTASNQVQLGNSATTTFAYGAVQNRSDSRDKAEIRDTILGLDFIQSLRPVDFKWNYREDYVQHNDDGSTTALPQDGSKTRSRYHHGLIAQEVKDVIESTGKDFGGFQDHSISGGDDVLSIGYGELIAPLIKAIQEQQAQITSLTNRINQLEGN